MGNGGFSTIGGLPCGISSALQIPVLHGQRIGLTSFNHESIRTEAFAYDPNSGAFLAIYQDTSNRYYIFGGGYGQSYLYDLIPASEYAAANFEPQSWVLNPARQEALVLGRDTTSNSFTEKYGRLDSSGAWFWTTATIGSAGNCKGVIGVLDKPYGASDTWALVSDPTSGYNLPVLWFRNLSTGVWSSNPFTTPNNSFNYTYSTDAQKSFGVSTPNGICFLVADDSHGGRPLLLYYSKISLSINFVRLGELAASYTATINTMVNPAVVTTSSSHNLADRDPIVFSTTGALPTGLVPGTVYYARNPSGTTLNLSSTPSGTLLDLTVSSLSFAFSSTNDGVQTMTASTYKLAQKITPSTTIAVPRTDAMLAVVGYPTGNVRMNIQTDSGGLPSGTIVTNGTSNTVDLTTLTSSTSLNTSNTSTTTYGLSIAPKTREAQTFSAVSNGKFQQIRIKWKNDGTATGTAVAKLYATAAGVPTGAALDTSTTTITLSTIPNADTITTFQFPGSYSLVSGTTYAISIEASTTFTGISWHYNSAVYASGQWYYWTGAAWTANSTFDLYFQIYTTSATLTYTLQQFTFPTVPTLTGSTIYHLVLAYDAGVVVDAGDYLGWSYTSAGGYAGGNVETYFGSWVAVPVPDFNFDVYQLGGVQSGVHTLAFDRYVLNSFATTTSSQQFYGAFYHPTFKSVHWFTKSSANKFDHFMVLEEAVANAYSQWIISDVGTGASGGVNYLSTTALAGPSYTKRTGSHAARSHTAINLGGSSVTDTVYLSLSAGIIRGTLTGNYLSGITSQVWDVMDKRSPTLLYGSSLPCFSSAPTSTYQEVLGSSRADVSLQIGSRIETALPCLGAASTGSPTDTTGVLWFDPGIKVRQASPTVWVGLNRVSGGYGYLWLADLAVSSKQIEFKVIGALYRGDVIPTIPNIPYSSTATFGSADDYDYAWDNTGTKLAIVYKNFDNLSYLSLLIYDTVALTYRHELLGTDTILPGISGLGYTPRIIWNAVTSTWEIVCQNTNGQLDYYQRNTSGGWTFNSIRNSAVNAYDRQLVGMNNSSGKKPSRPVVLSSGDILIALESGGTDGLWVVQRQNSTTQWVSVYKPGGSGFYAPQMILSSDRTNYWVFGSGDGGANVGAVAHSTVGTSGWASIGSLPPSYARVLIGVTGALGASFVPTTISINNPGLITTPYPHFLAERDPIIFSTTGALPTGLTAGVTYYVRNPLLTTFNLSLTPTGAIIQTTGGQSGTHTLFASAISSVVMISTLKVDGSIPANQEIGVFRFNADESVNISGLTAKGRLQSGLWSGDEENSFADISINYDGRLIYRATRPSRTQSHYSLWKTNNGWLATGESLLGSGRFITIQKNHFRENWASDSNQSTVLMQDSTGALTGISHLPIAQRTVSDYVLLRWAYAAVASQPLFGYGTTTFTDDTGLQSGSMLAASSRSWPLLLGQTILNIGSGAGALYWGSLLGVSAPPSTTNLAYFGTATVGASGLLKINPSNVLMLIGSHRWTVSSGRSFLMTGTTTFVLDSSALGSHIAFIFSTGSAYIDTVANPLTGWSDLNYSQVNYVTVLAELREQGVTVYPVMIADSADSKLTYANLEPRELTLTPELWRFHLPSPFASTHDLPLQFLVEALAVDKIKVREIGGIRGLQQVSFPIGSSLQLLMRGTLPGQGLFFYLRSGNISDAGLSEEILYVVAGRYGDLLSWHEAII